MYSDNVEFKMIDFNKFLLLCDEEKHIPLNTSYIALKGDEIENIWQKINNTDAKIEGKKIKDAVQFANAAAALSVTKAGAQASIPIRTEVINLMRYVSHL